MASTEAFGSAESASSSVTSTVPVLSLRSSSDSGFEDIVLPSTEVEGSDEINFDRLKLSSIPEGYCQPGTRVRYHSDELIAGERREVVFSKVDGPGKFVLLLEDEDINFFDQILQSPDVLKLKGCDEIPIPNPELLEPGLPVMVRRSLKIKHWYRSGKPFAAEMDLNNWYRAVILRDFIDEEGKMMFTVFRIDEGGVVSVPLSHIRYMRQDILDQTPGQVILGHMKSCTFYSEPSKRTTLEKDASASWTSLLNWGSFPMAVVQFVNYTIDSESGQKKWSVYASPLQYKADIGRFVFE